MIEHRIDAVWLSVSQALKHFDRPLIRQLSQAYPIARWEYLQSLDEPCSMENAVRLLHQFMSERSQPVHLLGHGLSGVLALQYAHQYPQQVRSLTLLGVAPQPALTWQSHYYVQRHLLPVSQRQLLVQIARQLFGGDVQIPIKHLLCALLRDLETAPSEHSLFRLVPLPQWSVRIPLLVCGGASDRIVDVQTMRQWEGLLKSGDRLWSAPQGNHFFHWQMPNSVSLEILQFWRPLSSCSGVGAHLATNHAGLT